VSFAAIVLCVASLRVFIVVYFVMTQSGNFWIHPRIAEVAVKIFDTIILGFVFVFFLLSLLSLFCVFL